jgi:CRP-like cAMP-binding protein
MNSLLNGKNRNRLLRALDCETVDAILDSAELVPFRRGDVLVAPNQTVSHAYFPISGICSNVALASSYNRIEAGIVGREGVVGIAAILGTGQSPHQCIAQVDGEAYRIGADRLMSLARGNPRLLSLLLRFIQVALVQAEQTALANGRFSIEKRLARWILMCHDRVDGDELNFTHELLSVMLGVRRPGVTVATHVLEGSKMIKATRGRLTVLSREKLEEAAAGSYGVPEAEYDRLIGPLRPERAIEVVSPAPWSQRVEADIFRGGRIALT